MASCAKNYKSGVLGKHVMSESEEAEEDRYRKIGRDAETIWEAETIRPFTVLLVEDDALTSKLVAKSLRAYTFDGESRPALPEPSTLHTFNAIAEVCVTAKSHPALWSSPHDGILCASLGRHS